MSRTVKPKSYFLIGNPVSHSLSPIIMNRAFGRSGFEGVYAARRVGEHAFAKTMRDIETQGAAGANITFPYKESVVPLIDRKSTCVEVVSAANTILFTPDGSIGHNTDASGLVKALEVFAGFSPKGKRALIFGAGGAGRAAAFGLLKARAGSVVFCVRDPVKAGQKLAPLRDHFENGAVSTVPMGPKHRDARFDAVQAADLLINATPLGMPGSPSWPRTGLIDAPSWIRREHVCFDLVYGTSGGCFPRDAESRGATYLNGIPHLIAQASDGLRLWAGRGFDLMDMSDTVKASGAAVASRTKESFEQCRCEF